MSTRQQTSRERAMTRIIATRLRDKRTEMNMTQQTLADHLGVSAQQIQKYESGMSRISTPTANIIAEALGVSVSEMFDVIGEATDE